MNVLTELNCRLSDRPFHAPHHPFACSGSTLIDLSLFFNQIFAGMPPLGRQTLVGGREFDIRGVIFLAADSTEKSAPGEILGISISQKCRRLHFLHAGWGQMKRGGTQIGVYRLRYADGQQQEIPIIYGAHLRHYYQADDSAETLALARNTKVAWVGDTRNRDTQAKDRNQLFEMTWENERPDVAIESLDFISRKSGTTPVLFAITAEP